MSDSLSSGLTRPIVLWNVLGFTPHSSQLQVLLQVDQALHRTGPRFLDIATGRQWGKTWAAEVALWMGLLQEDDDFGPPVVKVIADTYEHANLIWDRFIGHLFESPILNKLLAPNGYNKERELVKLKSGATAQKLSADNPERLTGFTISLAIVDESAFVQDRAVEHLLPCLAVRRGSLLAFGTAEGAGWHRTWNLHGQDPEYPAYWSVSYPSTSNPYFPPSELDTARQAMSQRRFQQLYMAEWQSSEGAVFHNIEGCILAMEPLNLEPEPGKKYILGGDFGRHHDYTVVYVGDVRTHRVVAQHRFNQIEWMSQADYIAAIALEYNKAELYGDASGVGDVFVDILRNKGVIVHPYVISPGSKEPLIEGLIVALEQEKIRFPKYQPLIRELQVYESRELPSGRIQTGAPSGYHDDCVNALALLNHGFNQSYAGDDGPVYMETFTWQGVPARRSVW